MPPSPRRATAAHVDIDGRRYSHIIDACVQRHLVRDLIVTVIADRTYADGLDTAIRRIGLALVDTAPPFSYGAGGCGVHVQKVQRVQEVQRVQGFKGFRGFRGFREFREFKGFGEEVARTSAKNRLPGRRVPDQLDAIANGAALWVRNRFADALYRVAEQGMRQLLAARPVAQERSGQISTDHGPWTNRTSSPRLGRFKIVSIHSSGARHAEPHSSSTGLCPTGCPSQGKPLLGNGVQKVQKLKRFKRFKKFRKFRKFRGFESGLAEGQNGFRGCKTRSWECQRRGISSVGATLVMSRLPRLDGVGTVMTKDACKAVRRTAKP